MVVNVMVVKAVIVLDVSFFFHYRLSNQPECTKRRIWIMIYQKQTGRYSYVGKKNLVGTMVTERVS